MFPRDRRFDPTLAAYENKQYGGPKRVTVLLKFVFSKVFGS